MEWHILDLDYNLSQDGRTNVVYHIHWKAQKTVDGFTSEVFGTHYIEPPVDTFIEYADLTEAQVLSWLDAVIPQEEKDELDSVLTARANAHWSPSTGRGLPW